jgi:hypothetical protein
MQDAPEVLLGSSGLHLIAQSANCSIIGASGAATSITRTLRLLTQPVLSDSTR